MIAFIDDHRATYGVEPICRVLPIAPSTYFERVAQRRDLMRLSARAQRDQALKPEVARVFAENFGVYGVRKVWRQMMREGCRARQWAAEARYEPTAHRKTKRNSPSHRLLTEAVNHDLVSLEIPLLGPDPKHLGQCAHLSRSILLRNPQRQFCNKASL